MEENQGYVGDVLEVSVILDNPAEISAGEFVLTYDPSVIKPREIQRGSLTKVLYGFLFISNEEFTEDSIKVAWAGLREIASAGTLSVITFQLEGEGTSPLEISPLLTDKDGNKIDVDTVHGSIVVHPGSSRQVDPDIPRDTARESFIAIGLLLATMAGLYFRFRKNKA